MKISIQAKSSSGEYLYTVDFIKENALLTAFCSCPAGILGKPCKHKFQLLSGNASMLENDSEIGKLKELKEWVDGSSFPHMHNKLTQIESEIAALKKEVKKEKKNFGSKMKEGF
jgi:uncharacterized Zn finger protein